jgi:diguanylate cyclase (GGDEF)-like protein
MANAVCLILANAALLLLLDLLLTGNGVQAEWWVQVSIAIATILAATFGFVHLQLHWQHPLREALRLLPLVRTGQATIAELDAIGGGIGPLVEEIEQVLRDLRRQRAEVTQLEMEMSQRVANRTDALQRTLAALKQQASKDALTGLYNRRMFELHLAPLVEGCRTKNLPLSLLMMDIDGFKVINDTLGHAAGDEFLRSLGQLIRSALRNTELAYRLGGDEFIIALPGAATEQAEPLMQRLITLVDGLSKPLRLANPPRLSVGLFASTDLAGDRTPESLLREADRLLYETKEARKAQRQAVMKSAMAAAAAASAA